MPEGADPLVAVLSEQTSAIEGLTQMTRRNTRAVRALEGGIVRAFSEHEGKEAAMHEEAGAARRQVQQQLDLILSEMRKFLPRVGALERDIDQLKALELRRSGDEDRKSKNGGSDG